MLSLIVAIGRNREIGKDGRMPWPTLSQDFKHLQEKTMGKTLLMGQKTFESLPGVLPKRFHIIVSDDPNFHKEHKRVRVERDLYRVLEECQAAEEEIVVFGGASIYRAALPYVERMYITKIDAEYDADTYFPAWNEEEWTVTADGEPITENGLTYQFFTYERSSRT